MKSKCELIINKEKNVHNVLEEEINNCDEFRFIVAFITVGGANILKEILSTDMNNGKKGKIITGTYLNFTDPLAIEIISEIPGVEIRMLNAPLHAKTYMFKKKEVSNVMVGSSNLTPSALITNLEWNMLYKDVEASFEAEVDDEFNYLWNKSDEVSKQVLDDYKTRYEINKQGRPGAAYSESDMDYLESINQTPIFLADDRKLISDIENNGSKLAVGGIYTKQESFFLIKGTKDGYSQQESYFTINNEEYALYFDISSKYGDKIISDTIIHWESRTNRNVDTPQVGAIAKNNTIKHLFIKTPKKSSSQYYYLGAVEDTKVLEEVTIDKGNSRFEFKLYDQNAEKVNIIRSLYK